MHPKNAGVRRSAAEPIPSEPPLLFCLLLAARLAGDRTLETLARDRLADAGVRVVFRKDFTQAAGGAQP